VAEFIADPLPGVPAATPVEIEPETPAATPSSYITAEVVASAIVEEAPAGLADAAPALDPSPRPAAKTALVASRKTEPCDQPLGPLASTELTAVDLAPRTAHASAAFQDRLVVALWGAGFAARMRTKAIVANARAARDRARQLTDMIAEFESRLHEARAISEAHAADHQAEREALDGELTLAIAECDRLVANLEAFLRSSEAQSDEV
jgi:hypothetical protein